MRVLLIGSGGREHAMAWKLAQSPQLTQLWCLPGNPGIAGVATLIPGNPEDPAQVLAAAKAQKVDLAVVGPEAPLVAGVGQALRAAGIPVFGPDPQGARLEGSKAFAKQVMEASGVPTAAYRTFQSQAEALAYAAAQPKIVIKADGLAAGKGVVVAQSAKEAVEATRALWELGPAGRTLVFEELLEGEELSLIALCDGERFVTLPLAQDHKRLLDGDAGPNTGGMGAYAPVARPAQEIEALGQAVIAPVLRELSLRNIDYRGALYAGLMMTARGPKVLEFNCRLGDPEAQVLMLQLKDDLLPILADCAQGRLKASSLALWPGVSVGVVMAARGYPGKPQTGDAIEGLDAEGAEVTVFQAGTAQRDGRLVTAGGRVLTVCARAPGLAQARAQAYRAVERIRFTGAQYRTDIGRRGLGSA